MKTEIIILKSTLTVEVNERVQLYDNLTDAIKGGCVRFIEVEVNLSTESGVVCEDDKVLEDVRQAIIYGLKEKG